MISSRRFLRGGCAGTIYGDDSPGAGADKLIHFLMYFGLASLSLAALSLVRSPSLVVAIAVVLAIALYAAADEWTQQLVPTRTGDWRDWAADVSGAMLGATLFLVVWRLRSRRLPASG